MTAAKMAPLPCPFCGSEAKSFDRIHSAWCECTTCGAESAGQATEGEAVALWNRRAAPAAPQGEPRKAAWVNRTAAGWLQLIVAGIVIKSEYSGDWDEYATVAAELNSEIFHLYAHPPAQAEPQPEAIPIAPVEVVRQALKELLESISECRMDQVTARFAKASVMARAVVDRYKDAT